MAISKVLAGGETGRRESPKSLYNLISVSNWMTYFLGGSTASKADDLGNGMGVGTSVIRKCVVA